MAVENKASKRIDEISALLVGEVIRYRDNRLKDIETLENAMLQSEKNEIKNHMDKDTQAMKEYIEEFLSESESLVEMYGRDDTIENQYKPQTKPETERTDSNPKNNRSVTQRAITYEMSANEMGVYTRLLREADERRAMTVFKEPEEQVPFEFVVMDRMANTDYPEKESDIRSLAMMSAPKTSVAETIENEGWPALYAGMNLKVAKHIPNKEKNVLSVEWLKQERVRLESKEDDLDKVDDELKFIGENHDQWSDEAINQKIQEIHERDVLIDENKIFYGSIEEERTYKQGLREQIKARYHVGGDIDLTRLADRILSRETDDDCRLTREEAIHLFNEEQNIVAFNKKTKVPERVNNIEEIAVGLPNHDLYIRRSELSAFVQQQFEEVLYNNRMEEQNGYIEELTGYRTEIDPEVGLQESINTLGKKKQPTAASVQDELEEDVEYGIGEVGDSNQEAIEEYMAEEITIEEDFER